MLLFHVFQVLTAVFFSLEARLPSFHDINLSIRVKVSLWLLDINHKRLCTIFWWLASLGDFLFSTSTSTSTIFMIFTFASTFSSLLQDSTSYLAFGCFCVFQVRQQCGS